MNSFAPKLKICVIGLGWMGYTHARHFSDMDDADLYVCDVDSEKIDRAVSELAVAGSFQSIDAALASDAIDAVFIILPHHLHYRRIPEHN